MSAETDLPINDAVPAPTKIEPGNLFLWNWRQMQVYAQACVAHATAPLQAEIDALRTRLEDTVRESTNKIEALLAELDIRDSIIATHAADTREYQKRISQAEARADKLAEALREAADDLERGIDARIVVAQLRARADLLRDQEEGHEQ